MYNEQDIDTNPYRLVAAVRKEFFPMKHRLRKCLAVCLVLALSASLLSFGAAEGVRRLTLYWTDEGVDYETCDVWIWFPGKDGSGHLFEPCEYGGKTSVDVPEDVSEVGFIVRRDCSEPGGSSWGNATKDYDGDRFAVLTGSLTEIYLKPGDPCSTPVRTAAKP